MDNDRIEIWGYVLHGMMEDQKKSVFLERVWAIAMKDLGIDAENVLRRAQLPLDLLSRDQPRVSVPEYFRMWHSLEEEAGDPTLPLKLAQGISPEACHPPIFAALCSPNLVVAVQRIGEYKKLCAPMRLLVEERADSYFMGFEWEDSKIQSPASFCALELAFITQIARIGTRETIQPMRVECPHSLRPRDAYHRFFGILPSVSDRQGVTFRKEDALRPFLTANEAIWETFKPELRRRLTQLEVECPLSERVRTILLEGLPSGQTSVQCTARRLGMSPRTLQRNLQSEGVAYKEIVLQTREQLARHYVADTKLGYAEISFLVGYEEPSSFFRAFRDWTGETPQAMRLAATGLSA